MNKERIIDLIEEVQDESWCDGYHKGFDEAWNEASDKFFDEGKEAGLNEAWDEARNKGFDEGFEEADEQNAKIIVKRDELIVELEEELEMMHEQIETSYNEGFEDGEDEQKAIAERLRWEDISDAIPKAYAEGQADCDCSKPETWISYEGRTPCSAYRFSTKSKTSAEVKALKAMVKAHNARDDRYGKKQRVVMAGRGPRWAFVNGKYYGNFYGSWLPEKSGNVTHWDVYVYDINPEFPGWPTHVTL